MNEYMKSHIDYIPEFIGKTIKAIDEGWKDDVLYIIFTDGTWSVLEVGQYGTSSIDVSEGTSLEMSLKDGGDHILRQLSSNGVFDYSKYKNNIEDSERKRLRLLEIKQQEEDYKELKRLAEKLGKKITD